MTGICEDRVVAITGAGRGLGREYALELARQGARVVINDLGGALSGEDSCAGPATEVVETIERLGGTAIANTDDISTEEGAGRLVSDAVSAFGKLDAVVNNAGILRDRALVNLTLEDWRSVLHVHLDGTFLVTQAAARHWRERSRDGESVDARIVNATSASGLFGNAGQANYSAAKGGIASLTLVAAAELERYGVAVNAVAPVARTRMTEALMGEPPAGRQDRFAPANVAPLVAWLCSAESASVTGRVLEISGGTITVMNGWSRGPRGSNDRRRWDADALTPVMEALIADAAAPTPFFA